jgi:hypothetical protein
MKEPAKKAAESSNHDFVITFAHDATESVNLENYGTTEVNITVEFRSLGYRPQYSEYLF